MFNREEFVKNVSFLWGLMTKLKKNVFEFKEKDFLFLRNFENVNIFPAIYFQN